MGFVPSRNDISKRLSCNVQLRLPPFGGIEGGPYIIDVEEAQSVQLCVLGLAPCSHHRLSERLALGLLYEVHAEQPCRQRLLQVALLIVQLLDGLLVAPCLCLVHLLLDAADFVDGFLHEGIVNHLEEVFSGCR